MVILIDWIDERRGKEISGEGGKIIQTMCACLE